MNECVKLLMERLPVGHRVQPYLEKELYRYEAGIRGEKRLREKMTEFYWHQPFEILWDIHLQLGDWKVQIDGLLVTPHCIVVIESKNISGKIHFDSMTSEFYRINNEGEKMVLEDPTVQLAKHIRFLGHWLKSKKVVSPSISGIVVFTSRHCEFITKPAGKYICKTYQITETLYQILEKQEQLADSPKPIRIRKLIESNHSPYVRPPLCDYYRIDPLDLKTGVKCPACRKITMERLYKSWRCIECGHQDSRAHVSTLHEYFILISLEIDSKEFRRFSGMESRYVVFRMLAEAGLVPEGGKRNRKYVKKD